jgi:hypothetical protein
MFLDGISYLLHNKLPQNIGSFKQRMFIIISVFLWVGNSIQLSWLTMAKGVL